MRRILGLAFLLILAAACGGDEESVPESLRLIAHDSFAGSVNEETFAGFTERTGIEVEVIAAGDAGSMVNQAALSKDNPLADVLFGVDDTFLSRALEEEIFVEHMSPILDKFPTHAGRAVFTHRALATGRVPGAFLVDELMPPHEQAANAYWQDVIAPLGIVTGVFCMVRTPDDNMRPVLLNYFRRTGKPAFGQSDLKWIQGLLPHLRRALGVILDAPAPPKAPEHMSDLYDSIGAACFLISKDGCVLHCNPAAELLLSSHNGVEIRGGRIVLWDKEAQAELDALLRRVIGEAWSTRYRAGGELLARRASGGVPLVLVATPLGAENPIAAVAAPVRCVVFVLEEGARVYVERINVRGNTRTRDWVVRREFDILEGDPYNRVMIDRAERRLRNLGYFKNIKITNEPGSAPDRVIVNVEVEEQLTGEFSVGGGYSTADGLVAEVSVGERNFLGRGHYVRLAGAFGQRVRSGEFSFTEPYFMDKPILLGGSIFRRDYRSFNFISDERNTTYSQVSTGIGLRTGFPLTEYLSFGGRYTLVQDKLSLAKAFFFTDPDGTGPEPSQCDPLKAGRYLCDEIGTRYTSLLGGSIVDANALLRSYIWHCIGIPLVASIFMAVHFWRIRKDGGISGPAPVMLESEMKAIAKKK